MTEGHRRFTDEDEVGWDVWEVGSPAALGSLTARLLAERRRSGWLVFESDTGEKRRLVRYPPDWLSISDFELAHWCAKAVRVPPAPGRREEDK
jgi:hypothetical protein